MGLRDQIESAGQDENTNFSDEYRERLRHGSEQENWTYAIDLGKVLDRLNLELLG